MAEPWDSRNRGVTGCCRVRKASLLGEARQYLARRADQQDISTAPAMYQLLYDFHVSRSDWQAAAAAQLALARRLEAEDPERLSALQGIAAALGMRQESELVCVTGWNPDCSIG